MLPIIKLIIENKTPIYLAANFIEYIRTKNVFFFKTKHIYSLFFSIVFKELRLKYWKVIVGLNKSNSVSC